MTQVLTQCGNDLSRENILKQAENLKFPLLLPGSRSTPARPTTPDRAVAAGQVRRRARWVLFGELYDAGKK